ncbi:MAG: tetratricopeptide repeat protein [Planctomycetota bacterium]
MACCLLVCVVAWGRPAPSEARGTAAERVEQQIRSARSALEAGDAAAAFDAALLGLEFDPDHVALLTLASRAAEGAERGDEALWYAVLAHEAAASAGASTREIDRLAARAAALQPLGPDLLEPITGYADRLFELGDLFFRRKLYVNAVDVFRRCEGTPVAAAAGAALEKLYGRRKAVEALLASGIDVPIRARPRKSPARIAREDRQHEEWEKAWEIKTDNYTVVTNMGYEMGTAISDAMEQMNRYYRVVFDHKRGGGGTARCTIMVYKSRAEFEEHENEHDPNTKGFFVPGENRVATYDPRTEGLPLAGLWETLFHECSHQFTSMISTGTIPCWLDEGTAVYLEGARLLPGGRVETNLIHGERLDELKATLEAGRPSLTQLVSYYQDVSYPGDFYAIGGGLVYFVLNYEDESSERVYAPLYEAFMRTYRSGGKHDVFGRFVEYFVTKAKQPGVETFEDFEARFETWMLELHDLYFGPPDRADRILDRARRQRAAEKLDAAVESYRWALRKRPNDPVALRELAEVYEEAKIKDSAISCYRRLLALARQAGGPTSPAPVGDGLTWGEVSSQCMARIERLDRTVAAAIRDLDVAFNEAAKAAARAYVEAGYPRNALRTLDTALRLQHGEYSLTQERRAVEAETGIDLWRWRRILVEDDLAGWTGSDDWACVDGAIACDSDPPRYLYYQEDLPPRYRFEATLHLDRADANPYLAVLFGAGPDGVQDMVGVDKDGFAEVNRVVADWILMKDLPASPDPPREGVRVGVEVDGGTVRFFIAGKEVGSRAYPPEDLQGQVGFMMQEGRVRFTEIRLAK